MRTGSVDRMDRRMKSTKIGEKNSFSNGSRRIRRVRSLRMRTRVECRLLYIFGEKRPKAVAGMG